MPDCEGLPDMPSDWADNGVFFDRYTGDTRISEKGKRAIQMVVMSAEVIARGDGLENTILLSENVDAGLYTDVDEAKLGMVWFGTGNIDTRSDPPNHNPPDDAMRINRLIGMADAGKQGDPALRRERITYARPSSYHPGGVNVIFCDGHGRFISQEIDYYVYCLLMSSNGKRVRVPGSKDVLPNFDREIKDAWIY
jgi:prepilin-type processing-associated H-X9-DG protein